MNNDTFWKLLDESLLKPGNVRPRSEGQQSRFISKRLSELSPEEIIGFDKCLYENLDILDRWDLWAIGYIVNGGCSDDGFYYFRSWIIAQGRAYFEEALKNPESAARKADFESADNENSELLSAASEAYQNVTGVEMPEIECESNNLELSANPKGEPWHEDDLPTLYPELCRRAGLLD